MGCGIKTMPFEARFLPCSTNALSLPDTAGGGLPADSMRVRESPSTWQPLDVLRTVWKEYRCGGSHIWTAGTGELNSKDFLPYRQTNEVATAIRKSGVNVAYVWTTCIGGLAGFRDPLPINSWEISRASA